MQPNNINQPPAIQNGNIYSAPLPNEPPAETAEPKSRKWWIPVLGSAITIALCVLGIVFQLNYHSSDASGKTASDLQNEIAALDEQISGLSETEGNLFETGGFSSDFYNSADERTEIELQKAELEIARDSLLENDAKSNIFQTGSAYFFFAALIIIFITAIAFVRL